MIDINYCLEQLFTEKRVFVSEADFQFALAWKIKELYPHVTIRLEYIPWKYDNSMHIDIIVMHNNQLIPIELKYKTKLESYCIDNEDILLKDHSAHNFGRYDFLYDIERMEKFKNSNYPVQKAYAIMMTNDSKYWEEPTKSVTSEDTEFRIHENSIISGMRSWIRNSEIKKQRKSPIHLDGCYKINWKEYKPTDESLFKFTVISI